MFRLEGTLSLSSAACGVFRWMEDVDWLLQGWRKEEEVQRRSLRVFLSLLPGAQTPPPPASLAHHALLSLTAVTFRLNLHFTACSSVH